MFHRINLSIGYILFGGLQYWGIHMTYLNNPQSWILILGAVWMTVYSLFTAFMLYVFWGDLFCRKPPK